ncbi:MAG: YdcF family protein [Bacteroidota bacterium]|nr:YdcF family protein [Bacteroidota bacterium]
MCIFYFFSNGLVFDECARLWQPHQIKIENITKTYDIGVILCGVSDYDSEIKTHNFQEDADRIIYTEKLYRMNIIKKILISGGNADLFNNGYKEAESLEKHLIENGIPQNDIIVESESRNTRENIKKTKNILNERFPGNKFLLITSAVHMKRALLCCKQAQLKIDYFATDYVKSNRNYKLAYIILPRSHTLYSWNSLIHEWIGYVVYKIID